MLTADDRQRKFLAPPVLFHCESRFLRDGWYSIPDGCDQTRRAALSMYEQHHRERRLRHASWWHRCRAACGLSAVPGMNRARPRSLARVLAEDLRAAGRTGFGDTGDQRDFEQPSAVLPNSAGRLRSAASSPKTGCRCILIAAGYGPTDRIGNLGARHGDNQRRHAATTMSLWMPGRRGAGDERIAEIAPHAVLITDALTNAAQRGARAPTGLGLAMRILVAVRRPAKPPSPPKPSLARYA